VQVFCGIFLENFLARWKIWWVTPRPVGIYNKRPSVFSKGKPPPAKARSNAPHFQLLSHVIITCRCPITSSQYTLREYTLITIGNEQHLSPGVQSTSPIPGIMLLANSDVIITAPDSQTAIHMMYEHWKTLPTLCLN
jgi:hypothetical protein